MTHSHNCNRWDDQELHKLFAARLPVLTISDDFAERLTQFVLDEVVRHTDQKVDACPDSALTSFSLPIVAYDGEQSVTVERLSNC